MKRQLGCLHTFWMGPRGIHHRVLTKHIALTSDE